MATIHVWVTKAFSATGPDLLSVQKGDVVAVIKEDDHREYVFCELRGARGWIPSTNCTLLETLEEQGYREIGYIGEGAAGKVVRVNHRDTGGFVYAMKKIQKGSVQTGRSNDEGLHTEKATHHHVVEFITTFETATTFNIVTLPVAANGNLEDFLRAWTPQKARSRRAQLFVWIVCLAETLSALHSRNLVHRDIKLANILIHGDNILFTDFGISYTRPDIVAEPQKTETWGTYEYIPPEIVRYDGPREWRMRADEEGDIWSLGCVFYEMLERATPFPVLEPRLLSRFDDGPLIAYHLSYEQIEFTAPTWAARENIEQARRLLGNEHERLHGLAVNLLNIVIGDMVTKQEDRKGISSIAWDIGLALREKGLGLCHRCNEYFNMGSRT
ncbi:kinase-like protein [Rhizodiscina lignyota]|uniref:Kinase-like protein n=1 Tax=Rhizodiscina lignyota TaxID=1504668 RepID=A0A9P4M3S6_9PEZI|nr:kinase-like protein [Rhizodiscina lignyota]